MSTTKRLTDDDLRIVKEGAVSLGSVPVTCDPSVLIDLVDECIARGRDLRTIRDGLVDVQSHLDRVTGRDSKRGEPC